MPPLLLAESGRNVLRFHDSLHISNFLLPEVLFLIWLIFCHICIFSGFEALFCLDFRLFSGT